MGRKNKRRRRPTEVKYGRIAKLYSVSQATVTAEQSEGDFSHAEQRPIIYESGFIRRPNKHETDDQQTKDVDFRKNRRRNDIICENVGNRRPTINHKKKFYHVVNECTHSPSIKKKTMSFRQAKIG